MSARTLAVYLAVSCLTWGAPQPQQQALGDLSIADVRQSRGKAEKDKSLSEGVRKRVLELYDEALASLESAERFQAEAARLDVERESVAGLVQSLRAELERAGKSPQFKLPAEATAGQVERMLTQERSELTARRSSLADLDSLARNRANRGNEIARRLGTLSERLAQFNEQIRVGVQLTDDTQSRAAATANLLAKRRAAIAESAALRSEQSFLEADTQVLPLRRIRAEQRVVEAEAAVELLGSALEEQRRRQREVALQQVRQQCGEMASGGLSISEICRETLGWAESLWGPAGVSSEIDSVTEQLTVRRKNIADIDRLFQITRRKFEAVGFRGVASLWWPSAPNDLPRLDGLRREERERERIIPFVQHKVIELEEASASATTAKGSAEETGPRTDGLERAVDAGFDKLSAGLRNTRISVLEGLLQEYTRYRNLLSELDTTSRQLMDRVMEFEDYIRTRVFWVRSVPGSVVPDWRDIGRALRWLLWNPEWGTVVKSSFRGALRMPVLTIGGILILVLLVRLRPRFKKRLVETKEMGRGGVGTWKALLFTLLLAAPIPAGLFLASAIVQSGTVPMAEAISRTFRHMAALTGILEFAVQALRPVGLAEGHFGWSPAVAGSLQRELRSLRVVFLPAAFVVLALSTTGMRFDSPMALRRGNDSLGRLCFIVAMSAVAVALWRILRPNGEVMAEVRNRKSSRWLARFRFLIVPCLLALPLGPALLALFGYYVTAYSLVYQLLRTLLLLMALVLAREILLAWGSTRQKKLDAARTAPDETGLADVQFRQLLHLGLLVVAAVGTFTIWNDALPPLRLLGRTQIYPELRLPVGEDLDLTKAVLGGTSAKEGGAAARQGEAKAPANQQATGASPPVGNPASALLAASDKKAEGDETAEKAPARGAVFLSDVFWGLLLTLITIVLVKDAPGLLEYVLLDRMPIDAGARSAATTLVRYAITIVGVSTVLASLGLSWSQIQWLVAALTFGLAFGLQEIFANFVSGIIVLLERPVRIGDAVTIGGLGGKVSRIQMRATTISCWDGSEMIVPNKEFITTKLVNWTLSDSKTRVDIPVGVAYGSDLRCVRELLLDVARAHPQVLADPPPAAVLVEFGESAIKFELRVFIDFNYGKPTAQDELSSAINDAFREHGIAIPFPQMDLHVSRRNVAGTEAGANGENEDKQT